MPLLDSLERKLGHLAIPHIIRFLAIFQTVAWAMIYIRPDFVPVMAFNRELILHGQVWRLLTWAFYPTTMSPLWILFQALLLFMFSDGLEHVWGAFRVNLYIIGGIVAGNIGGLFVEAFPNNLMLDATILWAFAVFFPDVEILLFFILPTKVKYIAWLEGAAMLILFLMGGLHVRLGLIFCSLNYLIAIGPGMVRRFRNEASAMERRARFVAARPNEGAHFHKCASCGKTDVDDPHLEFRVTADGDEYCSECRPPVKAKG